MPGSIKKADKEVRRAEKRDAKARKKAAKKESVTDTTPPPPPTSGAPRGQ